MCSIMLCIEAPDSLMLCRRSQNAVFQAKPGADRCMKILLKLGRLVFLTQKILRRKAPGGIQRDNVGH